MLFKSGGGDSEDTKNYVKLKDGESVVGVFAGEIYEFSQHWDTGAKHSVLCAGVGCALCASSGKKGSFRFRVNFIVKNAAGSYEPKILDQGWKFYKQLREFNEEYPLELTIVKISRQGSDMNTTTYSVLPVKDCLVKPELASKIASMKLIDLRHSDEKVGDTAHADDAHITETEDDLPF